MNRDNQMKKHNIYAIIGLKALQRAAKKQLPPIYHHYYYVLDALAALALQSGRMPEKASCACARTRPGGSPAST
jgi:hypothetical protein